MSRSQMYQEAFSSPQYIARQLHENAAQMADIGSKLRHLQPVGGVTVARGSSDHATAYFSYLCMLHTGLPVTSLPMSLTTLFKAPWQLAKHFALAISQSGQSTDIIHSFQALEKGGAYAISFVNAPNSPLAAVSTASVALHAGEEKSIAATKSYIASLSASAQLLAAWLKDTELNDSLQALPEILAQARNIQWQKAIDVLTPEERMIIIGRGAGLAIAQEAALKFKETCALQAEAFSGAEIKHGPMALVDKGYPVLIFAAPGPEQKDLVALAAEFRKRQSKVLLVADSAVAERDLDMIPATCASLSPVSLIQSFYIMVEALARSRGLNPDNPPFLNKVTMTI